MTIKNKNEIIQAQIQQHQAYIVYWQTMILSGANAKRSVSVGGYGTSQYMSEGELLQDALDTIVTHCQRIAELVDEMDRHYEEAE